MTALAQDAYVTCPENIISSPYGVHSGGPDRCTELDHKASFSRLVLAGAGAAAVEPAAEGGGDEVGRDQGQRTEGGGAAG